MSGTILVTGATGFIGGRLAARLATDGRGIAALDVDESVGREIEIGGPDVLTAGAVLA